MYAIYHTGAGAWLKGIRGGGYVAAPLDDAKRFRTERAARDWLARYLDAGYGLTAGNTAVRKVGAC